MELPDYLFPTLVHEVKPLETLREIYETTHRGIAQCRPLMAKESRVQASWNDIITLPWSGLVTTPNRQA